ncbi:MAG: DUF4097 family beta strand repeat-containing protein [Oscillospiraceae bacterium]
MKVSKKVPAIAYTILCVFLLVALLAGIKYIVDFGDTIEGSNYRPNKGFSWDSDSYEVGAPLEHGDMMTQTLSKSATSYEIDLPYGNITIMPTDKDEPYVEYSSRRHIEIQTNEDGGYSEIKVKMPKNIFHLFNLDEDDVKINFYLPKDKLASLDVDFNAGYLKIHDMRSDKFLLEMAAGNAVVKDCEFDVVETDLSAGNLDLYTDADTRSIESHVAAGNMKLMLPEGIRGFDITYKVDLGNIANNLSFNIDSSTEGFAIDKKGKMSYGDKSCKIDLEVAVGNININEY